MLSLTESNNNFCSTGDEQRLVHFNAFFSLENAFFDIILKVVNHDNENLS